MSSFEGMHIVQEKTFPRRPTLVFLHDSLGCVALWRDFPQKLARATQCNLLIYDRLGYGKSEAMPTHIRSANYLELEADVLSDLLIAQNIDDAILFGHSDGGSIALLAASKYPDRTKAVIAEAAHIFVEAITLTGINEAKEAFLHTNLRDRLTKYHGDKVDTLFKAWTEIWTSPDFRNWNIEPFLPGIHCPLLFIQGATDEFGTLAQVTQTVKQVSGTARSHVIPDTGHTPHKEAPDKTLQVCREFISSIKK